MTAGSPLRGRLLFLAYPKPAVAVRRMLVMLVVFNAALIGVTYLEGNWIIQGPDIGFFEDSVHAANIVGQLFAIWASSRLLQRIRTVHEPIQAAVRSIALTQRESERALSRTAELAGAAVAFVELRTPASRRAAGILCLAMLALVGLFQVYLPLRYPGSVTTWVLAPRRFPASWVMGILWNGWTFGIVAASALWVTAASALKVFAAVRTLIAEGIVRIIPLAPDGRGGVAFLGDLSLAQSLVLGSGVPWLVMWVLLYGLKDGALLIGAPIYLMVLTILFFLPLSGISRAMREAKKRDLERFSRMFNRAYLVLERSEPGAEVTRAPVSSPTDVQDLSQLHSLYRMAQDMPVWPFDVQTLRRFASLIGIPLLAILQQMVSDLPWKNLFLR